MIESIKQFVKMADYDAIINRIIIDETQIVKLQQEKENAEAKKSENRYSSLYAIKKYSK